VYFRMNIQPELPEGTITSLMQITAGNLYYPIGNTSNGTQLYRTLVDDSMINAAINTLTQLNKSPLICGVFDMEGYVIPGYPYNKAYRDEHFIVLPDAPEGSVPPVDNIAIGWGTPRWE
jgi:hypothetical protein